MTQKRISLLLLTIVMAVASLSAKTPKTETLNYKIVYRWGLVNKQAGRASFVIQPAGNGLSHAVVYARSEPWADHFYKVRDTISSTFNTATCIPHDYRRIAHEGGRYVNDHVSFSRSGTMSNAVCTRLNQGKSDKKISKSEIALSAEGDAVDLLSSYYYLRNLPFETMTKGETRKINIFSGKRKEILTFTFGGITPLKVDGKKIDTYFITFTFTSGEGKTTSKPIKAWLMMDDAHTPVKLEGELKIGKVQCILTTNK